MDATYALSILYAIRKIPNISKCLRARLLASYNSEDRHKIPEVWKQLMDLRNKFLKDAGVEITDLGEGYIRMKDKNGTTVIREKYEWE